MLVAARAQSLASRQRANACSECRSVVVVVEKAAGISCAFQRFCLPEGRGECSAEAWLMTKKGSARKLGDSFSCCRAFVC